MIGQIKKILGCVTNRELAALLQVDESTVSRWGKRGFHKSTERLIKTLIDRFENGKIKS